MPHPIFITTKENNSKMITPSFITLLSAFLVASTVVVTAGAVPALKPVSNLAYSPKILSPKLADCWIAGEMQTVTWQTANMPTEVLNYNGSVVLGHPDPESENLDAGTDENTAAEVDDEADYW
jgi:hypothetical protein